MSKFREAMLSRVSGKFPVAEGQGPFAGAKAATRVKREEGAEHFRLDSVRKPAADIEGEKKTDARHV